MSRMNRRKFVKQSLAMAGASFVVSHAGHRVLGANETIHIGVAGCGSRGGDHIGSYLGMKDVEVTHCIEPDMNRLNSSVGKVEKKQKKKPVGVQDIRKALEDKDLDCVSIATCNHWHALGAIWAMQAGKDVYVEKPVSHNITEGRRMVQAARKYGRICQVGTQYRSDGTCKAAARFMAEGKLGKVTLARSITYKRRGSIGPVVEGKVPEGVDYNLWAGPAPMSPITRRKFHYDWHWFWETGNGDLGNSDVHRADLVRFGLGVEKLPRAVMCYGGRVGYADAAQTANTQIVVHDFGDVTFVQEVRGLPTPRFHLHGGAIFTGSEGYVGMVGGASAFFDPAGKLIEKLSGKGDDHFGNFVQAVRSRDRGRLNAEILGGHLSAGLCHLGNISYRLGRQASPKEVLAQLASRKLHDDFRDTFERTREHLAANGVDIEQTRLTLGPWLEFDPDKERFVGNETANSMLTREYRGPFVVPTESDV